MTDRVLGGLLPLAMGSASARNEEWDPPLELAHIFDLHAAFVWRVLKRLGTPLADLDDALQEVFMIVMRELPNYEERGSIKAWLFTIARQVVGHARRATLRRTRREQAAPVPVAMEDPHAALERSEAVEFVNLFLSQLDERQATVFHLMEIEGMSAPEVATCLEVSVNTVYGRLRLAREQFERALRKQGGR